MPITAQMELLRRCPPGLHRRESLLPSRFPKGERRCGRVPPHAAQTAAPPARGQPPLRDPPEDARATLLDKGSGNFVASSLLLRRDEPVGPDGHKRPASLDREIRKPKPLLPGFTGLSSSRRMSGYFVIRLCSHKGQSRTRPLAPPWSPNY